MCLTMLAIINSINSSSAARTSTTTTSAHSEVTVNNSTENDSNILSNNVNVNDVPVSSASSSPLNDDENYAEVNVDVVVETTSNHDCNVSVNDGDDDEGQEADDDEDELEDGENNLNGNHNNSQICRFFLKGVCRFGTLCRFSHDLSSNVTVSGSNNNAGPSTSANLAKNRRTDNWADAPVFVPGRIQMDLNLFPPNNKKIVTEALANLSNRDNNETGKMGKTNNKTTGNGGGGGVGASAIINDSFCNLVKPNKTWASVAGGSCRPISNNVNKPAENALCPYEQPCPHGIYCVYPLHLELCDMCDQYVLHPTDQEQRRKHNKECLQQHEQAMELSFAIARSKDKTCGICFDIIMEKSGREKRFGILPNCNHIFCLECIRKWRQAKQFEHKITRSCPECRIASDFVCPSAFWVETKEEKDKLLNDYRAALGAKDCKYFKKGDGLCPFGNKCFYKHALPNGNLVDVGLPKRARKLRRGSNDSAESFGDFPWWEFTISGRSISIGDDIFEY